MGCTGRADNGEWAVSYHGTKNIESVRDILTRGYDPRKTKHNACSFDEQHRVYSTPNVSTADVYAESVRVNEHLIKFVFQNRINQNDMQTNRGDYWGAGFNTMRAYGLLIKFIN